MLGMIVVKYANNKPVLKMLKNIFNKILSKLQKYCSLNTETKSENCYVIFFF